MAFDRRAAYFVESKPYRIEQDCDVVSILDHQLRQLERIHMSHWRGDSAVLLDALTKANEDRIAVRVIALADAGRVEAAPVVAPNQLEVWMTDDKSVVGPNGVAA